MGPKHAMRMIAGVAIPACPLTDAAKYWLGPTLPCGGIAAPAPAAESTVAAEIKNKPNRTR